MIYGHSTTRSSTRLQPGNTPECRPIRGVYPEQRERTQSKLREWGELCGSSLSFILAVCQAGTNTDVEELQRGVGQPALIRRLFVFSLGQDREASHHGVGWR